MDKLLKLAVEAHGGLRAWNRLRTLTANVSIGGALWDLKKLTGLFRNTRVEVKLHHQEVVTHLPDLNEKIIFVPHQVSVESEAGNTIETRDEPRLVFAGQTQDTSWDKLHAGYFSSYALWGYLTAPRRAWAEVNNKLTAAFEKFTLEDWLRKHAAVSDEDFVKDSSRNQLAVVMSRTNHVSYHSGQAILAS